MGYDFVPIFISDPTTGKVGKTILSLACLKGEDAGRKIFGGNARVMLVFGYKTIIVRVE